MAIVKGISVNNILNSYCITDARMVHIGKPFFNFTGHFVKTSCTFDQ